MVHVIYKYKHGLSNFCPRVRGVREMIRFVGGGGVARGLVEGGLRQIFNILLHEFNR